MGGDPADACEGIEGARGDLAARLKRRGLELPGELPVPAGGATLLSGGLPTTSKSGRARAGAGTAERGTAAAAVTSAAHAPLGVSSIEQKQLFTPLAQQGSDAIEEERKRKAESERDLLHEVRSTLRRWVQECLAREEKHQKLVEKGMLKCRVKAKWSEGLHENLKQLIKRYGGKLAADCEKENSTDNASGRTQGAKPAWLPRQERWLVGFDAAAFEAFMEAHPEVVDPAENKVRTFVEEFVANDTRLEAARKEELRQALEGRFGPLRRALVERAAGMAQDAIAVRKKGTKRKDGAADKESVQAKRARAEAPRIAGVQDAAWAAATLAPLGLRGEVSSATLVARVPAVVALPLLEGLRALEGIPEFHEAMRGTPIGKVVNGYRHHASAEVVQAARELVAGWKAACRGAAAR
mmetsp:Transcript_44446/g.126845  ORF Transcript_44446/g.126845 Transcript_44446/m.126845 type:complete len:411 (+) Transcript_44446:58-1290(+)